MIRKVFSISILLLCLTFALGQEVERKSTLLDVNNFLQSEELQHANVGIEVVDLLTGEKLISHQTAKSLIPASLQKIITTCTALEVFGAYHRFKTSIQYDGYITDNVLYGNIYIKGGGDPTLASKHFEKDYDVMDSWANNIKSQLGITAIQGDIVGDASLFSYETNGKWVWEDIGNYYGASENALSYNDNLYRIYFQSGKADSPTHIIRVEPNLHHIHFVNNVLASKVEKDNAYIFGEFNSRIRTIRGTIPEHRRGFKIKGALPNPALIIAEKLKASLEHQSVTIAGTAKSLYEATGGNRQEIFYHLSEKMSDIIKVTNEESVNLYAELLLRHIGLNLGNDSRPDSCLVSIKNYWGMKGFDTKGVFLYDGSGLSPFNAVPASFFTKLLMYMHKYSPYKFEFINSLGVAGREGTLKWFGANPPLSDNLTAKSGSLTKVINYSGYLTTQNNKELAFTIIVNNYEGTYNNMKYLIAQFLTEVYHFY